MRRVQASLVVLALAAAAAVVVGGPGIAQRVGPLGGRVAAAAPGHARDRGEVAVAPVRGGRDVLSPYLDPAGLDRSPSPTATPAPPPAPPAAVASQAPGPARTAGPAQQIAQAVFQAIDADRAAAGLAPLRWSDPLARSAHQHDLAMAAADQLSHQLPGEPPLGTRESQQGVSWTWAGENIGYTSDQTAGGALGIHRAMMAERPPNDGHRRNILTTAGTRVGVDVVLDPTHHLLWLTEDFASA